MVAGAGTRRGSRRSRRKAVAVGAAAATACGVAGLPRQLAGTANLRSSLDSDTAFVTSILKGSASAHTANRVDIGGTDIIKAMQANPPSALAALGAPAGAGRKLRGGRRQRQPLDGAAVGAAVLASAAAAAVKSRRTQAAEAKSRASVARAVGATALESDSPRQSRAARAAGASAAVAPCDHIFEAQHDFFGRRAMQDAPMRNPAAAAPPPTQVPRPRPPPLTVTEGDDEATTPSGRKQESPPSSSGRARPVVPTEAELGDIFDSLDTFGTGTLGFREIQTVTELLKTGFHIDLAQSDAMRLFTYLIDPTGSGETICTRRRIGRQLFVDGIIDLANVLHRLDGSLAIAQMKVVLVAAFDKFDTDDDGQIDLEEFIATTELLGLHLSNQDAQKLHRFFAANQGLQPSDLVSEPPLWEKVAATWQKAMKAYLERNGWMSLWNIVQRVQEALNAPGSLDEKLSQAMRAVGDGTEDMCNVAELGADTAGLLVAISYAREELMQEVTNGAVEELDMFNLLPFAICIAVFAVNFAKEFDELVPKEMSADEALLYAQFFSKHGFSQAEFHRVLNCPGCKWETAQPGENLKDEGSGSTVKLIIKGTAVATDTEQPNRPAMVLGSGSSLGGVQFLCGETPWSGGEVIQARDAVTYISWDQEELRKCLGLHKDLSPRMNRLLQDTFVTNLRAVMKVRSALARQGAAPAAPGAAAAQETAESEFENVLVSMGFSNWRKVHEEDVQAFISTVDNMFGLNATKGLSRQLFDYLDVDGDGCVSPKEFRLQMREFERVLTHFSGTAMQDVLFLFMKGTVTEADMAPLMTFLDKRLGIGTTEKDRKRLFRHLDENSNGEVSLKELISKLDDLEDCLQCCGGITVLELATLLRRAFKQFDANDDGVVCHSEFMDALHRLNIPLSEKKAATIFSYLDADKDGLIDLEEWSSGDTVPVWVDAAEVAMTSHVERTGLAHFGYLTETIGKILAGEGDPFTKARRVLGRVWDSTDELADVANLGADCVGVAAALLGIWREISGVSSWDEVELTDLLPFLIFLGITGTQITRHYMDGQISDLTEQEALLYATVFEKAGLTITQFQRLMRYGQATFQQVAPGAVIQSCPKTHLRLVARGAVEISDAEGRLLANVGAGGFLGALEFLDPELMRYFNNYTLAIEPTTIVTWDHEALQKQLDRDSGLRLKVTKMMTVSMADRFLSVKDTTDVAWQATAAAPDARISARAQPVPCA